jgi:biotin carboxylase
MRASRERTLLVVSGGTEALAGIVRAKDMGLRVLVSDANPDAPGLAVADDRLLVSTYDVEATVAAARRFHGNVRPIDGVICIASDVALTVASVAADLGLPGVPLDAVRLSSDKLALKHRLVERGVPTPAFVSAPTAADLRAYVAAHGYPLVVKPVDSRGARGVLLLRDATIDLAWAHRIALRESPSGRVIVERFLEGPQVSTESLVVDGAVHTIGLADRNYEHLERFAPHVIENGGELPSRLDPGAQASVRELVRRAIAALGIRAGVVKGDVVVCDDGPQVIEVALRLSGGYLCTHEIPLSTGVDFVGQAIRVALGETPHAEDLRPTRSSGVAQRWLFPTPGRVRRVTGVEAVAARPDVSLCEVRVEADDLVPPVSSHTSRVGVVIATGTTRAQAIERARSALAGIEIQTDEPDRCGRSLPDDCPEPLGE